LAASAIIGLSFKNELFSVGGMINSDRSIQTMIQLSFIEKYMLCPDLWDGSFNIWLLLSKGRHVVRKVFEGFEVASMERGDITGIAREYKMPPRMIDNWQGR
jgi:hypothetical protein